jgi:hypothetical protein
MNIFNKQIQRRENWMTNLAELSTEGHGSKRAVSPIMVVVMI